MAKDIHVQGIDLDDVPAIDIPLQTSGTARFYDCTGTKSITQNGSGIDVKGYAAVDVNVSGGGGGTYQTKSVTPSESAQVVTADAGYDALEEVDVAAISSTYVGSGITRRSSSDVVVGLSDGNFTAPAGYYESAAVGWMSNAVFGTASGSVNSTGLVSVQRIATTPGYVSGAVAGTYQLTTQGAQTIHPSTSDQTIAASRYLTGAQTIKAVTTSNLTAANIKNGVTVTVGDSSDPDCVASVTGTYDGGGGGGGDSNIVHGTFTTGSSTGAAESHTIPYTGSGYPIAFICWVKGGAYNNTSAGNTDWYNSTQRYAVGVWGGIKSRTTEEPTYSTSGAANYGVTWAIYKNSTSTATSYTRTSSMSANMFSSSNANATATTNIRFRSKTSISVFVAGTSYGLPKETEFEYIAIYSS